MAHCGDQTTHVVNKGKQKTMANPTQIPKVSTEKAIHATNNLEEKNIDLDLAASLIPALEAMVTQ